MSSFKPPCKYSIACYRKNPSHFEDYSHPSNKDSEKNSLQNQSKLCVCQKHSVEDNHQNKRFKTSHSLTIDELLKDNIHGFFLTKLKKQSNCQSSFFCRNSLSLSEILNEKNGKLLESIIFGYMFDLEWLINQYPLSFRNLPLYIVFGVKKNEPDEQTEIFEQAKNFNQVIPVSEKIFDSFGTHHSKMMVLRYNTGIRLIISTANFLENDWCQKTQAMWISKTLPFLSEEKNDSRTNFKNDLLIYLNEYKNDKIKYWAKIIDNHDFQSVNVFLIASVPGKHRDSKRSNFGHMKFRKILRGTYGPSSNSVGWDIVCLFSSIGSLGKKPDNWLTGQFLSSLCALKNINCPDKPLIKCIFPTVENVRQSLEGYMAGGSLPYSKKVASNQPYLRNFLHRWKATISNRDKASPHIKSYFKLSKNSQDLSWFCLTSANLSKAAWGELQKNGSQLSIRSFEIGVLFLPNYMINQNSFKTVINEKNFFPIPIDVPLTPYLKDDQPWIFDLPYHKPDVNGNIWNPC